MTNAGQTPLSRASSLPYYVGTFLIAFATLALEVATTRILSVVTWYHLAFFAVSTAMLGMTAGAVTVFLVGDRFTVDRLARNLTLACLGFGLATPMSLVLLCLLPLNLINSTMGVAALVAATGVCSLPFYFSGIAIAAVLTRSGLPIGRIYAADLLGASSGCLFVLGGLEVMDAPSLVIACGAVGVLASVCFAWSRLTRVSGPLLVVLLLVLASMGALNTTTTDGIRPVVVKGRLAQAGNILLERWNSFSRVVVYPGITARPQLWGPSKHARFFPAIPQHFMNIDGEAGTTIRRYATLDDIKHLQHDVTNAAYYLRREGSSCVIGVGGGRDVVSAALFGHTRILGLDVNPIFIDLLEGRFREFAGIDRIDGLQLVADEARSYLSRHDEVFDVIQMSLIDTWAATGAGAFSLSENGLYTIEAWRIFLDRLSPSGIFTVSRWYNPDDLGETARIVSLALATLFDAGVQEPSRHLAMVTAGPISTLILSKAPLTPQDEDVLNQMPTELGYQLPIMPGVVPPHELLHRMIACHSATELMNVIADEPFNYAPPTDENPYFFNLLKPFSRTAIPKDVPGVIAGNLTAASTLAGLMMSLCLLAVLTIVVPLLLRKSDDKPKAGGRRIVPGAIYFSLIGAGFMLVEIALIQKMSLFLGHPIYALGVILSTIIASTGVGSWLSERVNVRSRAIVALPLAAAGTILALNTVLSIIQQQFVAQSTMAKVFIAVATITPTGMLLGLYFPVGMRLAQRRAPSETPWYWALNGVFGVLSSSVAVFVSISWGIGVNFYLGAICYSLLPVCILFLGRGSVPSRETAWEASGVEECPESVSS